MVVPFFALVENKSGLADSIAAFYTCWSDQCLEAAKEISLVGLAKQTSRHLLLSLSFPNSNWRYAMTF